MASPYGSPYARLVARCQDSDHPSGCWIGIDRTACRFGYQQLGFYVPGLGRMVKLMAHVAAWCWMHAACTTMDELYLAYCELRASGLELDHECEETACRNPAHLVPRTHSENIRASTERRYARLGTT